MQYALWSSLPARITNWFLFLNRRVEFEWVPRVEKAMETPPHLISFGAKKKNEWAELEWSNRGCQRRDWQLYTAKPSRPNRFTAEPVLEVPLLVLGTNIRKSNILLFKFVEIFHQNFYYTFYLAYHSFFLSQSNTSILHFLFSKAQTTIN